jgi:tRNA(Ile)-lysidine synthase
MQGATLSGRVIGENGFALAMAGFDPFEPRPLIAVAVSGGPDSMALVHLIDRWARARGGAAIGLTVDHGLRQESGGEALRVGAWLAARGVAHRILRWSGDKPASGIQQAARMARYRLLAQACGELGILHLALAHHADDQAETVLFRRDRGSGEDGLAGMAASRSLGAARLIRPLLGWRKADLIATCAALAQDFLDDPSNKSPRFARAALRARLAADPDLRGEVDALAAGLAQPRAERLRALWNPLAACVEIRPDGAACLDQAALANLSAEDRRAVVAATLLTVGGNAFAPKGESVSRLADAMTGQGFRGGSLAGCAIRPWRASLLICREPRAVAPPVILISGEWTPWDGRFLARGMCCDAAVTVGALGAAGFATLRNRHKFDAPAILGAGLPAIRVDGALVAAPHLEWAEDGALSIEMGFTPRWPLSSERFTVV